MKTKLTTIVCGIFCLMTLGSAMAQGNWNWPDDPAQRDIAKRKYVLHSDEYKAKNWRTSADALYWLLENNPNLNPAIYIQGVKAYRSLVTAEKDKARKLVLQDSVLLLYKMRMEHFPNDRAKVLDRLPYAAFKYYLRDPKRYAEIHAWFKEAFELKGDKIGNHNLLAYVHLSTMHYSKNPGSLTKDEVLDIHGLVSGIIERKIEEGKNVDALTETQTRIDQFLTRSIDLTCTEIDEKFGSKYRANPDDLKMAKKLIALAYKYECTDSQLFLDAAIHLFEKEPKPALARTIAEKYLETDEYDKTLEWYQKSIEIEEDNIQKGELWYKTAQIHSRRGRKASARDAAYKSLEQDPSKRENYTLIGNLYFNSFEDCKQMKSQVADRAVYIAAYEMFEKSGYTAGMNAAKAQFPSKENIFLENKSQGDALQVGCWINTTVTLRTRD